MFDDNRIDRIYEYLGRVEDDLEFHRCQFLESFNYWLQVKPKRMDDLQFLYIFSLFFLTFPNVIEMKFLNK